MRKIVGGGYLLGDMRLIKSEVKNVGLITYLMRLAPYDNGSRLRPNHSHPSDVAPIQAFNWLLSMCYSSYLTLP